MDGNALPSDSNSNSASQHTTIIGVLRCTSGVARAYDSALCEYTVNVVRPCWTSYERGNTALVGETGAPMHAVLPALLQASWCHGRARSMRYAHT